jgi:vacuolar-type H+-ATPase subunit H
MATTPSTPKKPAAKKPAARKRAAAKPRTAAARSTAARKGAVTKGVNRTEAAAQAVREDRKATQADTDRLVDAVLSTGRSAAGLAGNYAERAAYVQVGAVLTATDAVSTNVDELRTRFATREGVEVEIRKFEKRGETARKEAKKARTRAERELKKRRNRLEREVKRNRTKAERQVRTIRKDAEQQVKDLQAQVREIQIPQVELPDVVTPVREAVRPVVDRFAA